MPKRTNLEISRDLEDGNTKSSRSIKKVKKASDEPKKQSLQLKNHFMTWNNYPSNWLEMIETTFRPLAKKLRMQTEVGKSGNQHIQGCLELSERMRWEEWGLPKEIHWEKTRNKKGAADYCLKAEHNVKPEEYKKLEWGYPKPLKLIEIENFRPLQKELLELIETEPDDRKIVWICDRDGNKGKTCFMKYCCAKLGAVVCGSGKGSDAINFIFNADMDTTRVVFFAFPRTVEGYVSYGALESIKDGMIANTKYETGMKLFNPPHVIVMANFMPDESKLSADRWDIREW